MKKILSKNFLSRADFICLYKRTVNPLNKSYIDLESNRESNRARTKRFHINLIFIGENFHKNHSS